MKHNALIIGAGLEGLYCAGSLFEKSVSCQISLYMLGPILPINPLHDRPIQPVENRHILQMERHVPDKTHHLAPILMIYVPQRVSLGCFTSDGST